MIEFETYVKNESTLSTSEINQYLGIFQEVKFNKGEFFATEGEYSKKIAFLISGVMRAFFRDINGKEYNKTLFTKLNFVAPFSSLITGNRNLINIQCLTP
ncbi:MAG: Crp/Fnr family transcriptional regulator, partial [Cyclobacteriaceae bacterium]|nr:Crp/Fnr family transcriptional regulator [Cyclobacteriaceae bacterium]